MRSVRRFILVTGASSGIGRAVGRRLLAEGHQVIGVSRDIRKFSHGREGFHALELDLADLAALPTQIADIAQRFPELDAVVFSAGIGRFGALEQFSYAQIETLMAVNFTGQAFLARALLPQLKRKARSDLIFIGSEAALKGSRQGAVYCAGKFAVRGFAQALREECGKSGLRVALINPGMVKTEFFDSLAFEPGDHASNYILPEDVAETVSYVLDSRADIVIDEISLSPLNKVVKFKKTDR
ncbi:SDR family oxidoreductase [Methylomicrobium sp. RS1]|uniref:SDR family oxidoreductase n=1 Tax=Candidatus Methylomicrobium oryzae TaxID=2802053 RepID=UPI0019244BD8|nr:SDR family oxidoreductase [Methylomicrobium sp. RS1]MBL1262782.1 SDR family oxidoreductase [Methylomicrobium sp. RS1]